MSCLFRQEKQSKKSAKEKKCLISQEEKSKLIDKQCDKLSKFLKGKMRISEKNPSILRCQLGFYFLIYYVFFYYHSFVFLFNSFFLTRNHRKVELRHPT